MKKYSLRLLGFILTIALGYVINAQAELTTIYVPESMYDKTIIVIRPQQGTVVRPVMRGTTWKATKLEAHGHIIYVPGSDITESYWSGIELKLKVPDPKYTLKYRVRSTQSKQVTPFICLENDQKYYIKMIELSEVFSENNKLLPKYIIAPKYKNRKEPLK